MLLDQVSDVEGFLTILAKLSRGARVPLEFITYDDRHRTKAVLVTIDRHEWYAPPQWYRREDAAGIWQIKIVIPSISLSSVTCVHRKENDLGIHPVKLAKEEGCVDSAITDAKDGDIGAKPIQPTSETEECKEISVDNLGQNDCECKRILQKSSGTTFVTHDCELEPVSDNNVAIDDVETGDDMGAGMKMSTSVENVMEMALVMLEVHIPPCAILDGVHALHFNGTGIIVHHSPNLGLVAVDRNTVPIATSDIMLSFAAYPVEIPAEVVFLHPVHNYALVAYNPAALGTAGAASLNAAILVPFPPLRRGDSVHLVGLNRNLQVKSRKSMVTNPGDALNLPSSHCPGYRAMNIEVIELDTDFGHVFTGVLADDFGRVKALWGSFCKKTTHGLSSAEDHAFTRGIPVSVICEVVDKIINGNTGPPLLINSVKKNIPTVRILEVQLFPTVLSKARSFGLSNEWVLSLAKKDPVRRQVLRVNRCFAGSKAEKDLEQGDMLLAINGEPITCYKDVEDACMRIPENDTDEKLKISIFRQNKEVEVLVGTDVRHGFGTTRVVSWCGADLQDSHPAVRALGFLPEEGYGVYIVSVWTGSPADRYGLFSLRWIVEINGSPTVDLDSFLEITKELEHGTFVRIKTVSLKGKPQVLTLKQDLHYWPTWELHFDPDTAMWQRKVIKTLN